MGITWLKTQWVDALSGDVLPAQLQIAYDDTNRATTQWLLESPMFEQWLEELKKTPTHIAGGLVPDQHVFSSGVIMVSEIKLLHVQPFGPCSGETKAKEGMAYLSVTAEYVMPGHTFAERYRVPNLMFLRPNATAVLLVETDGTEEGAAPFSNATVANAIAVEQFRTPSARILMELPAGQVSGDVFSIASKEVAEETGGAELEIKPEHAVQTGGIYPSGGGCSEQLQRVFVVVKGGVKLDRLSRQASGTIRGVGGNERVKTVRIDLAELLGDCAGAKAHPLWADAKFHIAFPTLRDRYPGLIKAVCRK